MPRLLPACAACLAAVLLSAPATLPAQTVNLASPGGAIVAEVKIVAGRLTYNLRRDGQTVLEDSALGVTVDGVDLGLNAVLGTPTVTEIHETYVSTGGVHASAVNHCREMTLPVTAGGRQYSLVLRAYDDGLAYRYVVPGQGTRTVAGEASSWKLPAGATAYYQWDSTSSTGATTNYEGDPRRLAVELLDTHAQNHLGRTIPLNIGGPVTVKLPGGGYAAITEGALYDYSGMTLKPAGLNTRTLRAQFEDDAGGFTVSGTVTTPWRITMAAADLNGLVNSDIVHNVSPPPDPGRDWSFVRPGRAVWSWWADGNSPRSASAQRAYIDHAAALGFEYVLIDEGWPSMSTTAFDGVLDHARQKGVGVWVWKANGSWSTQTGPGSFYAWCNDKGIVGVKIDFMDSESKAKIDWYEQTLQAAAAHGIMINFHGANKPAGESRTYPNEVTREGVKGLEHYRNWYWYHGTNNATLPFTRFLAGHADFTPCTLDPGHLPYQSFAHQLATTILFTSPLQHWADDPANYRDEDPANRHLDVLTHIPTMWDQTLVLDGSEIMELAAFARRQDRDWFIGVVNGLPDGRTLPIDLAFLEGPMYKAILLSDNPSNRHAFVRTEQLVGPSDALSAVLRGDGGFVAWLIALDAGDANADLRVDLEDLAALAAHWNGPGGWRQGDFDGDGAVTLRDLAMLATSWNQGVPAGEAMAFEAALAQFPAIPEPATALLLAGAAAANACGRHGRTRRIP